MNQAILDDTGATWIFIMDNVDVENKCQPLTIDLPDGKKVMSTHMCDIWVPGLPTVLTRHIVPSLSIASLIGICLLCKAGWRVVFDNNKCNMIFNCALILRGYKDLSTDLWTLPIPSKVCTTPEPTVLPPPGPCLGCAPYTPIAANDTHLGITLATFTYSVQTRDDAVKFAHQSLCNPKITTLLKAVCKGFLKGCPTMMEQLIIKYLNPSPARAKGCMKHLCHGIHSTWPKGTTSFQVPPLPVAQVAPPVLPLLDAIPVYPGPAYGACLEPNVISNDDGELITNNFCFEAFTNKK